MMAKANPVRTLWIHGALLIVIGLVAYWPSLRGEFVFDDPRHIEENETVHSLSNLIPELPTCNRPVVYLTLWANYAAGGLNVFGYHAFNLAVHLTAGLLLWRIAARTLRGAESIAFAIAILWTVHPLQTQAVTYVIQRCESLMGMLYLLSLYCLIRGAQSPKQEAGPIDGNGASSIPALLWYAGGILAGSLAMGCKEVAITAPVVLLLYDRIFLANSWKQVVQRRWWFYVAFLPAVLWLLSISMPSIFGAPSTAKEITEGFQCSRVTWLEYLRSQPGVILHYLRLAVYPDRLCFDYWWPIAVHWNEILFPSLTVLGLLAAGIVALRYRPAVGFLVLSFFLILSPTSSFLPIADLAAEHRMYLPLAGVIALLVLGFVAIAGRLTTVQRERKPAFGYLLLFMVVALLTVRTYVRNQVYEKNVALWANTMRVAPHNARACHNVAFAMSNMGQKERAIDLYRRSIKLDPTSCESQLNLAWLFGAEGQYDQAEYYARAAVAIHPDNHSSQYTLGLVLVKQAQYDEAIEPLQEAIRLNSQHAAANFNLGRSLEETGNLQKAARHYRRAVELHPDDVQYGLAAAHACGQLGDLEQAVLFYEQVLSVEPQNGEAQEALAELARDQP